MVLQLDLNKLHEFHFDTTAADKRNVGNTTYAIFQLIGYLQLFQNETIIVCLPSAGIRNWATNFLDWWYTQNNFELKAMVNGRVMQFTNNSNKVLFVRDLADHHEVQGYTLNPEILPITDHSRWE